MKAAVGLISEWSLAAPEGLQSRQVRLQEGQPNPPQKDVCALRELLKSHCLQTGLQVMSSVRHNERVQQIVAC